jgi:hypothetical protein
VLRSNLARPRTFVIAGVVAAAFVGFSLIRSVSGSGAGASSPEAAVQQLVAAVDREDPLGAVDIIVPDEVGALRAVAERLQRRAGDAGFTGGGKAFAGVELAIGNPAFQVEELSDDVAKVVVTSGTLSVALDPTKAAARVRPLLERVSERVDLDERIAVGYDDDGDERFIDPFVVTVKRDGRWFVSWTHTVAQYLVEVFDLPSARFGDVQVPQASEAARKDPKAAFVELLEAGGSLDVDTALGLVTRKGLEGLWAHLDAVEDLAGEAEKYVQIDVDVDPLEAEEQDLGGGRRKLIIRRLSGKVDVTGTEGERYDVEFDLSGRCLRLRGDVDDRECVPDEFSELTGLDQAFVVMVKEDGVWRLDPMATVVEYAGILVDTVSEETVLAALGVPQLGKPVGALTADREVSGTLNPAGFAVHTFTAERGREYSVAVDDDSDLYVTVFGPDGKEAAGLETSYCSVCIVSAERAGEYRVVVGDEPFQDGRYKLVLRELTRAQARVGEAIEGSVDGGGTRLYTVSGTSVGEDYFLVEDGGESVSIDAYDDEGYSMWCDETDGCELQGGVIAVRNRGEDIGRYSFTVREAPEFGFDGGSTSASGSISSGGASRTFSLFVEAGRSVTVDASPSSDFDLVLRVEDSFGDVLDSSDGGYGGDTESVSFTAGDTGTYDVVVSGYGGSYGSFTLTARGS